MPFPAKFTGNCLFYQQLNIYCQQNKAYFYEVIDMNAFDSKLLDGKTKLHFVGIGGSGMFPLVQILH